MAVVIVLSIAACARRKPEEQRQVEPKPAPHTVNKSTKPKSSDAEIGDLTAALEKVRAANDLPALAGAVYEGRSLIARGAVGVRKLGDATRVTIDDVWHLGSDTKAMTATLFAATSSEGRSRGRRRCAMRFPIGRSTPVIAT